LHIIKIGSEGFVIPLKIHSRVNYHFC